MSDIDQRIERVKAECERRLRGRYELTLAQDGIEICAELTQLRHDFRELNESQKAWHRAFNEAERRAGLDSLACVPDSAFPLHEKIDAMRAVVDRLPKTADGVTVVLGMEVVDTMTIQNPSCKVLGFFKHDTGFWLEFKTHNAPAYACYSTREAAEAAKEAKP